MQQFLEIQIYFWNRQKWFTPKALRKGHSGKKTNSLLFQGQSSKFKSTSFENSRKDIVRNDFFVVSLQIAETATLEDIIMQDLYKLKEANGGGITLKQIKPQQKAQW